MASVIQVHRFLANLSLGDPGRQRELAEAIEELKQRQEGGRRRRLTKIRPVSPKREGSARAAAAGTEEADVPKLQVSKDDKLYRLYTAGLKEKAHQFERVLGGLRCIIHTNTPLEKADIVVVFFHGLGASPWHFVRVAGLLYEADAARTANIAYVFPFGLLKMRPGEFGAVEDSLYGSYKWWDIMATDADDSVGPKASPGEAGLLTNYALAVPTVLKDALTSPRIFPPPNAASAAPPPLHTLSITLDDSTATIPGTALDSLYCCDQPTPLRENHALTLRGAMGINLLKQGDADFVDDAADDEVAFPMTAPRKAALKWWHCGGMCMDAGVDAGELSPLEEKVSIENPKGRQAATESILRLISLLQSKYRIPLNRVGVCGFSQGAMLACDVFHRLPAAPAFLGVFSGAPMCVDAWKRSVLKSAAMRRVPVIQYHGVKDWVIPVYVGRWLHRFLTREGLNTCKYVEFQGEHELTEETVAELNQWIIEHARGNSSSFHFAHASKRRGSDIPSKLDDLFYKVGYGMAACLLPFAKKL